MPWRANGVPASLVLVLGAAALASSWVTASKPPSAVPAVPGKTALDYGFRFASAIDNDPNDRQKAQQLVVMEYSRLGMLDEALRRTRTIEGWRGGVALADLAVLLAEQGRADEARAAILEAERMRSETQGWQGPRIEAHIASARAVLGDQEAERIAEDLATNDPKQYTGRAAATAAAARAAKGDFAGAMATLDRLEGEQDMEIASGRTAGYVDLARDQRFDAADRRRALDAARRSIDSLPPLQQIQALQVIAEEYQKAGATDEAHELLERARERIEALPESEDLRPAMLSNLARVLALSGKTERVPALLAKAEAAVPEVLNIDQPAAYAVIASSWGAAGNEAEMWRLYGKAMDTAEALRNPRPRALAMVEICRSLGRNGIDPSEETRQRLDGLLTGLERP